MIGKKRGLRSKGNNMATFTLSEILKATNGTVSNKGISESVSGVSTDTRTIQKGELFIPLIGENFDGHNFLDVAVSAGASCVLVSETDKAGTLPASVTVVHVDNTLKALEDLARFHRLRFSIPVIAVTGSNGKTTTKDMTAAIMSSTFRTCATKKNFNNEIGLSQTLLGLTEEDRVCVVEMGMRGFGQIDELCHVACPTIGIVTNVGTSHIGILGSRENIAKAKSELVRNLPDHGVAILNSDDEFVSRMDTFCQGKSIYFGVEHGADVKGDSLAFKANETDYVCKTEKGSFPVSLRMLGIHNVYDALAATAAGLLVGVPIDAIQKTLNSFVPQSASQKLYEVRGAKVLDDSYNANPLSVEMAFRALAQIPAKRRILVLGDMLELGEFADTLHYDIGQKAAKSGSDILIAMGTLSRMTAKGARDSGMKTVICCDNCEEAAMYLKKYAACGDAVLIKGSHAMHMETIAGLWEGDQK